MEKGDASTQKFLMSYFLQAATSASKEWLVLHQLRKLQRPVRFFSSELTFSQSKHLITAVIKDCACSRRPAAPAQVKKTRKANEQKSPHLSTLFTEIVNRANLDPQQCVKREGKEQRVYLSSWHNTVRKIMHPKMLTVSERRTSPKQQRSAMAPVALHGMTKRGVGFLHLRPSQQTHQ